MIGEFIHTVVSMTVPILLAALGGLFTDLSGILNIGLEGMMLSSCFFSVLAADMTGSVVVGVLSGIAISTAFAGITAFLGIKLRANIFVAGLATNLMSAGLTVFLSSTLLGSKGTVTFTSFEPLSRLQIPLLNDLPLLGRALSGYNILEYLAFALVIITYFVVFKTPYGYHLQTVGKNPETARSVGISVEKHIVLSFLLSGVFCGLAGAALSLPMRVFVGGMSSGRGWIALVAVVLGRGNPLGVLVASLIFGAASALSNLLQAVTNLSADLLLTIPFFVTLTSMVVYAMRKQVKHD
ncbi:MAG: ABC transporter permease [Thermotogae bacterium]|nr:MAG: ABC transporter permease [Thermotogota bacterium]